MHAGNNPSRTKHARKLSAAALLIACCASMSLADTPTELFRRGNDLMRQGKATEAVKAYTEAQSGGASSAVDTTIPQHFADVLLYNLGSAQLAAGNLAEADRSLRAVIERSPDASLRAKAGFNLGSLEATRAEPLAEDKPQEAVDTYRKAERFFRAALTDDPSDTATRENIDAVQRRIAALLEKIKQQEEEKKKQQQQQEQQGQSEQQPPPEKGGQGKDTQNNKSQQNQGENKEGGQKQQDQQQQQQSASDALNRLSQEQKEQSRKSEEQAKQQPSDEKSKQQAESAQKQEDLRKQTEQAAEQLRQQAEKTQDPKQKEQLQEAAKKAQDATEQQKQAERDLKQGESEKAAEQQKQAADKLSEAQANAERADEMRTEQEQQQQDKADAKKDDQQKGQQQQQAQAAQEAQQGKDGQQRPFDATAAQILDKEKENKRLLERYYRQLRGKPAPVKKDW